MDSELIQIGKPFSSVNNWTLWSLYLRDSFLQRGIFQAGCPSLLLIFEAVVSYHAAPPCKTHRRKGGGGGPPAEISHSSVLIHVPFSLFSWQWRIHWSLFVFSLSSSCALFYLPCHPFVESFKKSSLESDHGLFSFHSSSKAGSVTCFYLSDPPMPSSPPSCIYFLLSEKQLHPLGKSAARGRSPSLPGYLCSDKQDESPVIHGSTCTLLRLPTSRVSDDWIFFFSLFPHADDWPKPQ